MQTKVCITLLKDNRFSAAFWFGNARNTVFEFEAIRAFRYTDQAHRAQLRFLAKLRYELHALDRLLLYFIAK